MPPISEEEDRHSTAITSLKVSSLKTGVTMPFRSSGSCSNCSTKSGGVTETSDCSAFPYMMIDGGMSQDRVVSEHLSVCDQQATQQLGNGTFQSLNSKVKNSEEGYRRTGDICKLPKLPLLVGYKGIRSDTTVSMKK